MNCCDSGLSKPTTFPNPGLILQNKVKKTKCCYFGELLEVSVSLGLFQNTVLFLGLAPLQFLALGLYFIAPVDDKLLRLL